MHWVRSLSISDWKQELGTWTRYQSSLPSSKSCNWYPFFALITDEIKPMKPIYSEMTMSNWLNENFVLRPGYDSYYFCWWTYTHLISQTHYGHFICEKYSVIGRVHVIVQSFFLTYLKVETGSGYPGNCNWVPGLVLGLSGIFVPGYPLDIWTGTRVPGVWGTVIRLQYTPPRHSSVMVRGRGNCPSPSKFFPLENFVLMWKMRLSERRIFIVHWRMKQLYFTFFH